MEHYHNDFYKTKGKVDESMTFRRRLSLALMAADFIDLGYRKKITNVLVMLGVDEHRYVNFSNNILKKMQKDFNFQLSLSTIYSPIIKGFNG